MYGCEVGCIPVPTECCCNSHSIWSVVVHHKLNISASRSIIFVHWLWNSGHGVGLTTELRPLQGDCEIAVFKVGLVTPYGYHRRVWNICTVLKALCHAISADCLLIEAARAHAVNEHCMGVADG